MAAHAQSPAFLILQKCRCCSKHRHPREFIVNSTIGYCLHCLEWHRHALEALAGNPPPGCSECGITFAELRDREQTDDVRMYIHPREGLYGVFCKPCSDAYERKRLDLYGGTPYARAKGLA